MSFKNDIVFNISVYLHKDDLVIFQVVVNALHLSYDLGCSPLFNDLIRYVIVHQPPILVVLPTYLLLHREVQIHPEKKEVVLSSQFALNFSSRFLSGQFALIFLTFSFSRNISSIAIPTLK